MVRKVWLLLVLLMGGMLAPSRIYSQTAMAPEAAGPKTTESAGTPDADFLQSLPRPPDAPASLYAPAPPLLPPPDLQRPYFQQDPLLDPPAFGLPGWYADTDVGILKPVLKDHVTNMVTFPDGSTAIVGLPSAKLNWTASPRWELGYRLPSGFGGISLAYRFMVSQGTNLEVWPDGPNVLTSRLDFNVADLDWTSREYTPWSLCDMRVRFGLRYISTYFDSQASEPFNQAAGGGIFNSRTTSSYVGIGPHAGLDLFRRLNYWGLSLVGNLDLSSAFGRIRQNFYAASTTLGADGSPMTNLTTVPASQAVPIVNARIGLSWQPPSYPNIHLSTGYQFEYVWHVGEINSVGTGLTVPDHADFWDSGAYLRFEWNF